jgi:hypothetical protein
MSVIFPPDFDVLMYRNLHHDLKQVGFDDKGLADHYLTYGKKEGRRCSNIATRNDFISIIPRNCPILEIRPGFNPIITGENVYYFETMNSAELIEAAINLNVSTHEIPAPQYISPSCDLSIIDKRFSVIVSNHDIGKHTNLLKHISQIEQLLNDDGILYCILPDKNYSSGYYMPHASFASVLAAKVENRTTTPFQSIIEHTTRTTHHNSLLHWHGDHGNPRKNLVKNLDEVLNFTETAPEIYNRDIQINSFNADGFTELMDNIYLCGLTKLKLMRIYQPVRLNNEFYAVLQKQ